jgi:hypothetical protein
MPTGYWFAVHSSLFAVVHSPTIPGDLLRTANCKLRTFGLQPHPLDVMKYCLKEADFSIRGLT